MFGFPKKTVCIALAVASMLTLSGCGKKAEETVPPTLAPIVLPTAPKVETTEATDPRQGVEYLAVVMTAGDLYTLDYYPDLKSVDLSGSTCYWAIWEFMENHPDLEVTFTVDLGGTAVPVESAAATLEPGGYTYDALAENLQYLPNLLSLSLPQMRLSGEQIRSLMDAYPSLAIDYTVDLFGNTVSGDTLELDLSSLTSQQLDEACEKLGMMANLTRVNLSSALSLEEVDALQTAAPHIVFDYPFTLFGQRISTGDEEVYLKKLDIGNEGEEELRRALMVLEHCQRVVLDTCGFDYEVLAAVREDFRAAGPKVVWRVVFGVGGRYTTLTDDTVIRCVKNITDDTCGPMKYLEDVVHADLGHNDTLSDLSFVGYMTKIETLIASGCAVSDLSGFENCKNLTWLELAYCGKLKDITPLTGLESLKFLNLSYTGVNDYTPLDNVMLERFVCLSPKVSTEGQNAFIALHPKDTCITLFYGSNNPYGYGWRYNDNGKTRFWYYDEIIREVFNLDQADAILNAQKKAEGG